MSGKTAYEHIVEHNHHIEQTFIHSARDTDSVRIIEPAKVFLGEVN